MGTAMPCNCHKNMKFVAKHLYQIFNGKKTNIYNVTKIRDS